MMLVLCQAGVKSAALVCQPGDYSCGDWVMGSIVVVTG